MKDLKDKLGTLPSLSGKTAPKSDNSYSYDSRRNVAINARIAGELVDKLKRDAYQRGVTVTDLLESILLKHYKDKDFPPVPKKNLDL